MSFINYAAREINVKIVFYGPGLCGKTTNLQYIFEKSSPQQKGKLISLATETDRTLFFDFLPFDMGKIKGYDVKVQLYTVPGQVKYDATRELVLRGVDGVVFVADSMEARRQQNLQSLKNLQDNLAIHKKSIFKIPLVLQYNKRDLAEQDIPLLSVETLEKSLNSKLKVPSLEASAVVGTNVVQTLKKIISMTMASVENQLK